MKPQKFQKLMILGLASGLIALSTLLFPQRVQSQAQTNPSHVSIIERFTLMPTELKDSQQQAWRTTVQDDRGIKTGGIFSGLYHVSGDPSDTFYATADRGPNGQVKIDGDTRRTFPVPDYSPVIYKLQAREQKLAITQSIPIRTQTGKPITGLPNTGNDEVPYSFDGKTQLNFNPNGLDIEGLTRAKDGTFWVCDEYSPSVAQIKADGTLVKRLVPQGMTLNADAQVNSTLPAIYSKRRQNRGFEGLTLSQDNKRLFVALQSPLDFPEKKIGRASRMIRLLVVNPETAQPVAEYVYPAQPSSEFGEAEQGEMKIGDVDFVNANTLLVVERTDQQAKIYQVEFSKATNILGSRWDDLDNKAQSLEALKPEELRANQITPVSKRLVVDLTQLKDIPEKIEGMTIIDPKTLAIGNDNDFGFSGFDAKGRAINNEVQNSLIVIRLPQALPLDR